MCSIKGAETRNRKIIWDKIIGGQNDLGHHDLKMQWRAQLRPLSYLGWLCITHLNIRKYSKYVTPVNKALALWHHRFVEGNLIRSEVYLQ